MSGMYMSDVEVQVVKSYWPHPGEEQVGDSAQ